MVRTQRRIRLPVCNGGIKNIPVQQQLHSTKALSNTVKAGLLACNIFTALPIAPAAPQWATRVKT